MRNNVSGETIHQETKECHGKNYQTSGYYLKLYRSRKNYTQKELAELLGIKENDLSEMENNKRAISKSLAKKIADILNMDSQKLL